MATLQAKAGVFTMASETATTVKEIRSVGFAPDVVFFMHSQFEGSLDDATPGQSHSGLSFGYMSGATDRCAVALRDRDGEAVSVADHYQTDEACIVTGDGAGRWDFSAMDPDGFDLIVDDAFDAQANTAHIGWLALEGLSDFGVSEHTTGTATGNKAFTGVGFKADMIIILQAGVDTSALPTTAPHGTLCIGAASSVSNEHVILAMTRDGDTNTTTQTYVKSGECLAFADMTANPPEIENRASFVEFGGDGFTLNFAENTTDKRFLAIALKGVSVNIGNDLMEADTVTGMVHDSFGFTPVGGMGFTGFAAESVSDTPDGNLRAGYGFFSGATERVSVAMRSNNGVGTSVVFGSAWESAWLADAAGTNDDRVDVDSLEADGFTNIMDNAAGGDEFYFWIAFGTGGISADPSPISALATLVEPSILVFDRRIKLHVKPRKTLLTVPDRRTNVGTEDIATIESPIFQIEGERIQYSFLVLGAQDVSNVGAEVYRDGAKLTDASVFASGSYGGTGSIASLKHLTALDGDGGGYYTLVVSATVDGSFRKWRTLIYIVDFANPLIPKFALDALVSERNIAQIVGEELRFSFYFQSSRLFTGNENAKVYWDKDDTDVGADVFLTGDSHESADNILSVKTLTTLSDQGDSGLLLVPEGDLDGDFRKAMAPIRVVAPGG